MKWTHAVIATVVGSLCLASGVHRTPEVRAAARVERPTPVAREVLRKLPLAFEENRGQTDKSVRFLVRDRGMTAFVCPTETVFALRSADANAPGAEVVRMRFVDAAATPVVESRDPLPGTANYFIGNDSSRWLTGIPTCGQVVLRDVWQGVDVVWRGGEDGRLTYDLVVAPGADLGAASFELEGARLPRVDVDGSLGAATALGELRHGRPVAYQVVDGARRSVEAAFAVDGHRVGFAIGDYDRTRPLVVDPSLTYTTYLGGSGADYGRGGIAVDATGAAYVAGYTGSTDFPTQSAYQAGNAAGFGNLNAVIAKIRADGSALVYATYLGGSTTSDAFGIAVDGSGAAFVTGLTTSTDFPTLNALQPSIAGTLGGTQYGDVFVTKLAPSGSALAYSTYLGGTGDDVGRAIALDATGAAYVVGSTDSSNFPTQAPLQAALSGPGGVKDAFIAKIASSGGSLAYSTYLGGSGGGGEETAYAVAVDSAGAAYVAGSTSSSTGFPTQSPLQGAFAGGTSDAFVAKVNSSGSALGWSTFLGGSGADSAKGIAVDSSGAVLVAGTTASTDFPTTAGSFQPSYAGGTGDAFVAKIGSSGAAIAWSTFLGGTGGDSCSGIALDASGAAAIAGSTGSSDFPTASPTQSSTGGDAFVGKLDPSGSSLLFGTYLGGSGSDWGLSIAVGSTGDVYVAGETKSANFPLQSPLQATYAGVQDWFVARYAVGSGGGGPPLQPPAAPTNLVAVYVDGGDVTLTWTDNSTNESGFEIERRSESSVFELLGTTGANATSAPDRQLQPSTTYTYRVRAFNAAGASAYTNERSITTAATQPPPPPPVVPEAPSGLVALPSADGTVHLSWLDNSDDETVFRVQRADAGGRFDGVGVTQADVAEFDDADVRRGWPVAYRVRAASLDGASAYSNTAPATVPATIELALTKGLRTDSAKLFRDTLRVAATYAAGGPVLDPAARGLELVLGPQDVPLKLSVAAGDPAWKVRRGKATWKSAKGASPKVAVVLDTKRRRLTVTVSGGSFFRSSTPLVNVLLACGADGGGVVANWTERKPGVLRFPR